MFLYHLNKYGTISFGRFLQRFDRGILAVGNVEFVAIGPYHENCTTVPYMYDVRVFADILLDIGSHRDNEPVPCIISISNT